MLLRVRSKCTLTHTCTRSRASRAFHGQPGRDHPALPACATPQDELTPARGHGTAAPQPGTPAWGGCRPTMGLQTHGSRRLFPHPWAELVPVPSHSLPGHWSTHRTAPGHRGPFLHPIHPSVLWGTTHTPQTQHTPQRPTPRTPLGHSRAPRHPSGSARHSCGPGHTRILRGLPCILPSIPASFRGFPAAPGPCIPPRIPASSRHRSPPRRRASLHAEIGRAHV